MTAQAQIHQDFLKLFKLRFEFFFPGLNYPQSKVIYVQIDRQIEKWSKILHFILAIAIPVSMMLPNLIVSYFNYFVLDLGDDSFEFSVPTWYAIYFPFTS